MLFYRLIQKNGRQSLINLSLVRNIKLKDKIIMFEYVVPDINGALSIVSSECSYEKITYDKAVNAEIEYNNIIQKLNESNTKVI